MKILIDTHIFLFLAYDTNKIGKKRVSLLEDTSNDVLLSAVSIAELMIKESIGKIKIEFDPISFAAQAMLKLIDFTSTEALYLKSLPFHHKDPFDRMLICQGIVNDFYLMTDDDKFNNYNCRLI